MTSAPSRAAARPASGAEPDRAAEALPAHLTRLPGGPWRVWRQVGLRGAGFPADDVLRLAEPGCAAAADRLIEAAAEADRLRESALDTFRDALDALRAAGDWEDLDRRKPLLRAISRVRKGRSPGGAYDTDPAVVRLGEAEGRAAAEAAAYRTAFDAATVATGEALRETAADLRFQEAVIWQNRKAYETGIRKLGEATDGGGTAKRNARRREHEALVVKYLQRYCVKNDSIGFFGPVGWARTRDTGPALTVTNGPGLLDHREVYFDQWCVDALAHEIGQDPALARWIPPRRLPHVHLGAETLHIGGRTVALPADRSAPLRTVLGLCDGTRTAEEVCRAAGERLSATEEKMSGLLESMRSSGLIAWDLEFPLQQDPESALRQVLAGVGDDGLRTAALARMDRLADARLRIRGAAGKPAELGRAFDHLESTFTELTGKEPTRAHGETYGARTLLYEDCRRDDTVGLGPELLEAAGAPLTLMLTSARWLTHRVAAGYREVFRTTYDTFARRPGADGPVRFSEYWQAIQPLLLGRVLPPVDEAVEELQRRWHAVLGPFDGRRRLELRVDDIQDAVREAFAAPDPGWNAARYQCPDLMVAGASAEAVAGGDFQLVMGELHVGANTLRNLLFVNQHPDPEQLSEAVASDVPEPRIIPVLPKYWLYSSRALPLLTTDKDRLLLLSDEASWYGADPRALPVGSLTVALGKDGEVVARAEDGTEYDMVEVCAEALSFKVVSRFQPLAPHPHTPRITIDRLVVCRESWRFRACDLAFARSEDEADRFAGARQWARSHGMPRFVFVKAAHETKPFYVDLDSPAFVNAFAHAVRGAPDGSEESPTITVTEMLPTAEQLWLTGPQGQRYTSEFRFVAVDSSVAVDE